MEGEEIILRQRHWITRILPVGFGVAIVAAAFIDRLILLNKNSLWLDELYSVTTSFPERTISQLWAAMIHDVHPPLYALFLHYWMSLFGTSEIAVRMPSLIAGIGTIMVALAMFRPLIGNKPSIVFGLLFALGYGPIWYSLEARSYAIIILLSTTLLGISLRVLDQAATQKVDTRQLGLFSLNAAILSLFHYFGLIISCAYGVVLIVMLTRHRNIIIRLVLWSMPAAAISLSWTIYHYYVIPNGLVNNLWITPSSIEVFYKFLIFSFGNGYLSIFWIVAIPILMTVLFYAESQWRHFIIFAVASTAVGVSLALLISMRHPMITDRNLLVFLPAVYLVTALGFTPVMKVRVLRVVPLLFILGVALQSLAVVRYAEKTNWRSAANHLISIEGCRKSAIFVAGGYSTNHYKYYTADRFGDVDIEFINIRRNSPIRDADWQKIMSSTCPVFIWAVESADTKNPQLIRDLTDRVKGDVQRVQFTATSLYLRPLNGTDNSLPIASYRKQRQSAQ